MKRMIDRIDALREAFNIGIGRGASALGCMTGSHVRLNVIHLKMISPDALEDEKGELGEVPMSCVQLPFEGNISGVAELVFPASSAGKFVTALTHDMPDMRGIDSIRASTLREIGNVVLNAVMGTISNFFTLNFVYSLPRYAEGDFDSLLPSSVASPETTVALARTHFNIENLQVDGMIMVFFAIGATERLLETIGAQDRVVKP